MTSGQLSVDHVARTAVRGRMVERNILALRDSLTVEQRTLTPLTFYPLKAEMFFYFSACLPQLEKEASYHSVKVRVVPAACDGDGRDRLSATTQ